MPRARSVAIALTAAALAMPSAALAQGSSGAGDDQYNDPFESSGSGQTTPDSQAGSGSGLTQDPNLGGGSTSSGSSTFVPSAAGTLPNTGSDPRLLILAGLALLLSGLGLRLRTADETF